MPSRTQVPEQFFGTKFAISAWVMEFLERVFEFLWPNFCFAFSKAGCPRKFTTENHCKTGDVGPSSKQTCSPLPPPNNVLAQHGSYVLIAEHDGRHTDERKRQEAGSQLLYTQVSRDGTKQPLDDGNKIKPHCLGHDHSDHCLAGATGGGQCHTRRIS